MLKTNTRTPLSTVLRRLRDVVENKPVEIHTEMEEVYKKTAQMLLIRYEGEPIELVVRFLNTEIAKACHHEAMRCEHVIHMSVENDFGHIK